MAQVKEKDQKIWALGENYAIYDGKQEAEENGVIEDESMVDKANEPARRPYAHHILYLVKLNEKVTGGTAAIPVRPVSELPENASVACYIGSDKRRYVRWVNDDETDILPPDKLFNAPGWVWDLYARALKIGYASGIEANDSKGGKVVVKDLNIEGA